jgi:hypothetical protein
MARRWEKAFLTNLAELANVSQAAKNAGVARQVAYRYRDENPDFAAAWDEALALGIGTLEDEAVRRARDGVEKPVWQRGEFMGTVREYSDTLLIFILKTRKPEVYNPPQRQEHSGPGGSSIPLKLDPFAGMSDDDLDRFIQENT